MTKAEAKQNCYNEASNIATSFGLEHPAAILAFKIYEEVVNGTLNPSMARGAIAQLRQAVVWANDDEEGA